MSVIIPPDLEMRMSTLLGTGRYASEVEVLRAAVSALEEQDGDLAAIQKGVDDMTQGRCRSFAEFDKEFRNRNLIGKDV